MTYLLQFKFVVLRYILPMHKVFQMPLELRQLTDEEFWQKVNQIDELCEEFEHTSWGFSLAINSSETEMDIPFIRFKKTFPSKTS